MSGASQGPVVECAMGLEPRSGRDAPDPLRRWRRWNQILVIAGIGSALIARLLIPELDRLGRWLNESVLAGLATGILLLALDVRAGRLPWTRLLLPCILFVEGVRYVFSGGGASRSSVLGLLGLEALFLVLALRSVRTTDETSGSLPERRLGRALEAFLPPMAARMMAAELVVLGAAMKYLMLRPPQNAGPGQSHGYHENALLRALLPALPVLLGADFIAIDLLIPSRMTWLRVGHALVVGYAGLWLVGTYALIRERRHLVGTNVFVFHRGILGTIAILPADVKAVRLLPEDASDIERRAAMRGAHRLDVKGVPKLEIMLHRPVFYRPLMGAGRESDRLIVSADDPSTLAEAIRRASRGGL